MNNFWNGKSVIITGANGFLGSHLSIALLKAGAGVTGIIKDDFALTFLNIGLEGIPRARIKLIKSDIVDCKSMFRIFKEIKPQVCLHVAAQPIVGLANKSPLATLEANIKGTWNILEAARGNKTGAVVVASSDKAYGDQKKLPYTEESGLLALHPYDSSKACADILTRCYSHTYGLNAAVTRCANIYGPGDFNFSRIIPDTLRSVILNKDPVIRSDGTPIRDYVFIDDIVKGYLLLAKNLFLGKINKGQAFNFGTKKPISVLSLVNKIIRMSDNPRLRPRILGKKHLKGEIQAQYLSSSKANRELGWRSSYPLDKGLRITLDWYAATKDLFVKEEG